MLEANGLLTGAHCILRNEKTMAFESRDLGESPLLADFAESQTPEHWPWLYGLTATDSELHFPSSCSFYVLCPPGSLQLTGQNVRDTRTPVKFVYSLSSHWMPSFSPFTNCFSSAYGCSTHYGIPRVESGYFCMMVPNMVSKTDWSGNSCLQMIERAREFIFTRSHKNTEHVFQPLSETQSIMSGQQSYCSIFLDHSYTPLKV